MTVDADSLPELETRIKEQAGYEQAGDLEIGSAESGRGNTSVTV